MWWALNNASKWQMGFNSAFKMLRDPYRHFVFALLTDEHPRCQLFGICLSCTIRLKGSFKNLHEDSRLNRNVSTYLTNWATFLIPMRICYVQTLKILRTENRNNTRWDEIRCRKWNVMHFAPWIGKTQL